MTVLGEITHKHKNEQMCDLYYPASLKFRTNGALLK